MEARRSPQKWDANDGDVRPCHRKWTETDGLLKSAVWKVQVKRSLSRPWGQVRWAENFTLRLPYQPGQHAGTHSIRGWVGSRAGLDSVGEKLMPVPGSEHRFVQDAASPNTNCATPGSEVTYIKLRKWSDSVVTLRMGDGPGNLGNVVPVPARLRQFPLRQNDQSYNSTPLLGLRGRF